MIFFYIINFNICVYYMYIKALKNYFQHFPEIILKLKVDILLNLKIIDFLS